MYEDKTPETIKAAILSALTSDIDKQEGSFADDMAGPLAVEIYKVYNALNAVKPMVWVDETSGPFLDLAAADLGMEPRKEGAKAFMEVQITGTPGAVIAPGTMFRTGEGLMFSTDRKLALQEGIGIVEATAAQKGAMYNLPKGDKLYPLQGDGRIKSAVVFKAGAGGTEDEGDDAIYKRIDMARKRPATSGNVYDYEKWALEVSGVGDVRVTPVWDGPGTVRVLLVDENRRPVDDETRQRCADHIETVRPIGPEVTVKSAQELLMSVAAGVRLDGSADLEIVLNRFKEELQNYFGSIPFRSSAAGEKYQSVVKLHKMEALLMGVDGVADYGELLLNGATADLAVGSEEMPVVGEVLLTCV